MIIEIKGVQFHNKGAELMLHAVLKRIRHYWPNANIALEHNERSPYLSRAKLGAYQKVSIRKNILDLNRLSYLVPTAIRTKLKHKWGLVTEADIDVVLDAAGFAYGDQWGSLKIRHLGAELHRSHKCNKKYIFLPQAFGPFSRDKDITVLKRDLPLATLVHARDDISHQHLLPLLEGSDNLVQYPDFTNDLNGIIPDYWKMKLQCVCFIPNNNMVGERNKNESWRNNYLRVMTTLMQQAQSAGFEVVLLNHEGPDDRAICDALNAQMGGSIQIIEESDPILVKGILGHCSAVVCSRFHGCVSALSQAVPCLGTSWSHKYEKLYEEYQASDLLLSPEASKEQLEALLHSVLPKESSYRQLLAKRSEHFKAVTEQMWQGVFKVIGSQY